MEKLFILQEGQEEEERHWKTYFGALRRERNVGFRRGRGEECVPVVWRTHVHSLPGGVVMNRWNEKREEKRTKFRACAEGASWIERRTGFNL